MTNYRPGIITQVCSNWILVAEPVSELSNFWDCCREAKRMRWSLCCLKQQQKMVKKKIGNHAEAEPWRQLAEMGRRKELHPCCWFLDCSQCGWGWTQSKHKTLWANTIKDGTMKMNISTVRWKTNQSNIGRKSDLRESMREPSERPRDEEREQKAALCMS